MPVQPPERGIGRTLHGLSVGCRLQVATECGRGCAPLVQEAADTRWRPDAVVGRGGLEEVRSCDEEPLRRSTVGANARVVSKHTHVDAARGVEGLQMLRIR